MTYLARDHVPGHAQRLLFVNMANKTPMLPKSVPPCKVAMRKSIPLEKNANGTPVLR